MPPERPDPSTYAELNVDFYQATPWDYFERRLSHLMLVAADRDRYRAAFSEPVALGAIQIEVSPPSTDVYPTSEQSFIAVESEVLLHHTAETLLRFVHAHADPDELCPWLRMSALTSAKRFKEWIAATVVEAPRPELAELCGRVFACHPDSVADLDAYIDYTRMLAEHFLDSAPYNAAKHGMGLTGGSERRQIQLDGVEIFRRDGAVINWLAAWPQNDPEQPAEWTRARPTVLARRRDRSELPRYDTHEEHLDPRSGSAPRRTVGRDVQPPVPTRAAGRLRRAPPSVG